MDKEEAKEALIQASRIIDQWEKNELDSREAMEMISPLLKTIAAYLDLEQIPAPAGEKKSLYEDLEAGLEEEKLEDLETYEPEEDLFTKESEDLESKDESKSKSKKRKEFAGSNGEIPF